MIVRTSRLLIRCGMVASVGVGSALVEGGAIASKDSVVQEIDEPVLVRESIKLGSFQTKILKGKTVVGHPGLAGGLHPCSAVGHKGC